MITGEIERVKGISAERRIHLVRGEQKVSSDTGVVLTTILGSCVAACIRDPAAGIGGMNHFLLPGGDGFKHGVHAMELLLNALLSKGARRDRLEAKLFGGARMMDGLTDVGELNATFAERFLDTEAIPLVGSSLRGQRGRTIQFWPVTGRARQMELAERKTEVFHAEARVQPCSSYGSVEMF